MGAVVFGSAGTASASTVVCTGAVEPLNKKKPGVDAKLDFVCSEEIRGFGVTTNKTFDFFGTELEVIGPDGVPQSQSATIQCEGNVPGPGFGCGTTNRASAQPPGTGACEAIGTTGTAPNRTNTFGPPCNNRVDPGDTAELQIGFPQNPCKPTGQYASGKDKLRVWLSVLTEPSIGSFSTDFGPQDNTSYTRGAYISQPFKLRNGYRCAGNAGDKSKSQGKKSGLSRAGLGAIGPRLW